MLLYRSTSINPNTLKQWIYVFMFAMPLNMFEYTYFAALPVCPVVTSDIAYIVIRQAVSLHSEHVLKDKHLVQSKWMNYSAITRCTTNTCRNRGTYSYLPFHTNQCLFLLKTWRKMFRGGLVEPRGSRPLLLAFRLIVSIVAHRRTQVQTWFESNDVFFHFTKFYIILKQWCSACICFIFMVIFYSRHIT